MASRKAAPGSEIGHLRRPAENIFLLAGRKPNDPNPEKSPQHNSLYRSNLDNIRSQLKNDFRAVFIDYFATPFPNNRLTPPVVELLLVLVKTED